MDGERLISILLLQGGKHARTVYVFAGDEYSTHYFHTYGTLYVGNFSSNVNSILNMISPQTNVAKARRSQFFCYVSFLDSDTWPLSPLFFPPRNMMGHPPPPPFLATVHGKRKTIFWSSCSLPEFSLSPALFQWGKRRRVPTMLLLLLLFGGRENICRVFIFSSVKLP